MKESIKNQLEIIKKGTNSIISEEDLIKKLERSEEENRPLIIKLGLDPSAPDIHLGHSVVLRKMKQMQDLGHKVVIIIGDFTGKIGDPTGKAKGRVALSDEEVIKNAKTYEKQIFKILDKEKTEVVFNSEWLSKLTFDSILKLAASTTVARILERDDFQNRYSNNTPIGLHEFFYPLMQAMDSVQIKADIELGGTDQTFNILMGRNLQKHMEMEQQVAIFMPIIEGLDGKEKMSKSLGNYIGINEDANIMFKKVMEVPDDLIIRYFNLVTDEHPNTIREIENRLNNGENPRDIKFELAKIITSLYHEKDEVNKAIEFFNLAFKNKDIPKDVPKISINKNTLNDLLIVLLDKGIMKSRKEFTRILDQGGVKINNEKVDSLNQYLENEDVIKIGKKVFFEVNIK